MTGNEIALSAVYLLSQPVNPRDQAFDERRNVMRIQRLAVVLTVINFVLLLFILGLLVRPALSSDVVPVLRAHELQIVDDQGRGRAQIIIAPASTLQDGTIYPETVVFRLSDPNGRPGVKLSTSVDGAILDLTGDSERNEWSGVQILGNGSLLKLVNRDGQERILQP